MNINSIILFYPYRNITPAFCVAVKDDEFSSRLVKLYYGCYPIIQVVQVTNFFTFFSCLNRNCPVNGFVCMVRIYHLDVNSKCQWAEGIPSGSRVSIVIATSTEIREDSY